MTDTWTEEAKASVPSGKEEKPRAQINDDDDDDDDDLEVFVNWKVDWSGSVMVLSMKIDGGDNW